MADTLDIIKKLVALATNNPSEEEASAAALKACQLIQEHGLGAAFGYGPPPPAYKPDPVSEQTIDEILRNQVNPDAPKMTTYQTGEISEDHYRQRIIDAWKAIKVERARIEAEWHRLEKDHYVKR